MVRHADCAQRTLDRGFSDQSVLEFALEGGSTFRFGLGFGGSFCTTAPPDPNPNPETNEFNQDHLM